MQRIKRLTKRERKEQSPSAQQQPQQNAHIHCVACGRHLNPQEFSSVPQTAKYLVCEHQSRFPSCTDCEAVSRGLIADHDRTGKPIAQAQAWH